MLVSSLEPGCPLLLSLGVASEALEDKVASRRRLTSRGCEGRLPEMGGVWQGGRALNAEAPEDSGRQWDSSPGGGTKGERKRSLDSFSPNRKAPNTRSPQEVFMLFVLRS